MGDCNNNPDGIQLKSAIRKLLAKQYVVASTASNCLDSGTNSGVFALDRKRKAPVGEEAELCSDDITKNLSTNTILCENILFYISGFVVRSLQGSIKCPSCIDALLGDPQQVTEHDYFMESHQSLLFHIKNRGALIKPSNHVFKVILHGESILKVVLAQLGLHHPRLREALFQNSAGQLWSVVISLFHLGVMLRWAL